MLRRSLRGPVLPADSDKSPDSAWSDCSIGLRGSARSRDTDRVRTVAFDARGRILASTGSDRAIRLWDAESGEAAGVMLGHTGAVRTVAFSPEGSTLASASDYRTVRLWKIGQGQISPELNDGYPVSSVAFSPDGGTLISADHEGFVRIYRGNPD